MSTTSLSSSFTLLQDNTRRSRTRLPVAPITVFTSRRSCIKIKASSFTDFTANPNTGGRTELDALSHYSEVVPDTVVFDDFERFPPTAATVSPALLLGICSLPDTAFKGAVDTALADKECYGLETPDARMTCFVNKALVNVGGELSKLVPGRVSTEVDARLAYDTHAIVGKVENLLRLYNSIDVPAERLLFKIPSTWQGIEAARLLESEGIQTHMTFVYSFSQAAAAAQAGASVIQIFVGRLRDWSRNHSGDPEIEAALKRGEDPGLALVTKAYNYIQKYGHKSKLMVASIRNKQDVFLEILKQPRGLAKKDQVLVRVHSALKGIADLVPLAPSRLEQIVRERVPNVFAKEAQIVVYVENMLMLAGGEMGHLVRDAMIFELVNRLVDLDVDIGWDEVLQDDPSKGIFEMELNDMARPVDESEMEMEEPQREYSGRKVLWGNVVAQKLDTLMVLTFDHLQSCYQSGRLDQVFKALLQSFQSTVLNAYKSKFAQFVMFYACSLDPEDCGTQFVTKLLEIFTSTVYPQDWRMSAVSYLASYMARAKFLSASYVTIILESLVDWCNDYCENQSGEINLKNHRVFYAGCQAVMYVLCFRLRSILATPQLKSQLCKMPLEQIFKHALNPLEVCLPSIVEEFLRQCNAAQLFRVSGTFAFHGLLESDLSRAFGGFERLDLFFPFDPYLLKKSDKFIRPNFIYWSMVRTTYDDEDEDEEGTSDEDEAEAGVSNGRGPMNFEDNEFDDEGDMNLNKMSITPRNSSMLKYEEQHRKMQMPSRIRPSTSPESL